MRRRWIAVVILSLLVGSAWERSSVAQPKPQAPGQETKRPPKTNSDAKPKEEAPSQNAAPLNVVVSGKLELLPNKEGEKKKEKDSRLDELLGNFFSDVKWTDILLAAFMGLLVWVACTRFE